VPQALEVHLVVDNYATHKHDKVRGWLAAHPRRFGLTSSPNEPSVAEPFAVVKDLIAKVESFVIHYNAKSKPFMWTATADSILEKFTRLLKSIHGTR
jgi:putative transposase